MTKVIRMTLTKQKQQKLLPYSPDEQMADSSRINIKKNVNCFRHSIVANKTIKKEQCKQHGKLIIL